MKARVGVALLIAVGCTAACELGRYPGVLEIRGEGMGTGYSVTVAQPPPSLDRAVLEVMTSEVLERVDARMSTWRDDSELMRFNRSDTREWFPVSAETAFVVGEALRVSALSDGAFDPTVGPLVKLWGFGGDPAELIPPPSERLAETRERIGFRHLRVRDAPPALRKDRPRVELDLSGVAKGYAVDALAERLSEAGALHFLVEIGGELRARGRNARGDPWRVAIERPALARGHVQAIVSLSDASVATSGHYRNFAVRGDARFSHILDPRSARPVRSELVSVSVIAPTAARADALATALLVLGPEAGWALADREGLAVLFLLEAPEGIRERSTARFDARRTE